MLFQICWGRDLREQFRVGDKLENLSKFHIKKYMNIILIQHNYCKELYDQ